MAKLVVASDRQAYEQQINANAVLGWTPKDILNANKDRLLAMQHRLALGNTWGVIEIPEAFMPDGASQYPCNRIHKLPQFLLKGLACEDPIAEHAWTQLLRFVVARLTVAGPHRTTAVGYSTCSTNLLSLRNSVRDIVGKSASEGYFWSRIEEDSKPQMAQIQALVRHYYLLGALPDSIRRIESIEADEPERDRLNEQEHEGSVEKNKKWQPFPMEFTSEMGWRTLRLIKSVAPGLLDALEAALRAPKVAYRLNGNPLHPHRARELTLLSRDEVILAWDWRDENQLPLLELGFAAYKYTTEGKEILWPPRTFGQAMRIAHVLVKPAHLWMVLLCNGNRNSEVVSMRTDCLTPASLGNFRWKGLTYKMTGIPGGRQIEAEVPEIVGQSILQQIRLAEITRLDSGRMGNYLWVGDKVDSIKDTSNPLNAYMDTLGLRYLLGKDSPTCHEHRFRKTLARLVALALTNSIMVLKDCLGHRDAVMTLLSYIASDPTIAMEVIKVQKELTIMMAVDVITNRETVGGPGAPALRQRADEHLKRIGKSKFDPQDAYEFARRETFDGRSWMLVAPGVVCTAPHGSVQVSTPCALGQQQHNPANCKTGCDWQLLLSGFEKSQADDTVDYALKNLQRALEEEDEAGIAMWKGQAKTWLYRYDDVADNWKNHSLVLAHVPRPVRVMMKNNA